MSRALDLYRFTNDLTYSELPPPDQRSLAPPEVLDEDAIKEENAREFYRFELAFPRVSGAQDQLETHAATLENFAEDGRQKEKQDDPVWTQIQEGMENEIAQVVSKIQVIGPTEAASEREAADDPITKISRYTDSMAKTGVADRGLLASLLPTSVVGWLAGVAQKTGLNELIAWWGRTNSMPSSAEPTADNEDWRQATRADALYHLLTARLCPEKSHCALLRLPGWGDSAEGNMVFRMFLSCCSEDGWQSAMCTFESLEPDKSRESRIDICSKIRTARPRQAPLLLSFSDSALWTTRKSSWILSEHEQTVNRFELETLLSQGYLKTNDLGDSVRKFRLALRLASSLHLLCFGPWVQRDWTSHSVQIIPDKKGSLVEMLDEAYVSCVFNTDCRQTQTPPTTSQESSNAEVCPKFFLSLAQLLADIAYGERRHRPSSEADFESWYALLADDVRKNINDQLMGDYWSAIQGCLLYLENYDNWGRNCLDEKTKDGRLLAQEVIYEHIVRHLQRNLSRWEEQQKAPSFGCADSGSETKRPHGRTQSSAGAQRAGHEPAMSSPVLMDGAKFTLWYDEDNEIIPKPTDEPRENSFISHMKTFLDRVRVAIIDTGLYIEEAEIDKEGDPFLDHPDVQSRVVAQRNFFSPDDADSDPDPDNCEDEHGHGTQVARLVLKFAPRAEVVVAKISNSKTLRSTKTTQLVEALRWAGEQADIINLSFSLGCIEEPKVGQAIRDLTYDNKLIFVAASNTGGYGLRLWPASMLSVFAIHAANEFGNVDRNMNPSPQPSGDNFATFGYGVKSYWKGHYRVISGTSFATPVAAAIAANILEFVRRTQPPNIIKDFTKYGVMRKLFRERMTENRGDGVYHLFKPWAEGLWDGRMDRKSIDEVLLEVSR
ncbi:hypothetical protein RB595_007009 [Gaeumannomyces hyphopodioides]